MRTFIIIFSVLFLHSCAKEEIKIQDTCKDCYLLEIRHYFTLPDTIYSDSPIFDTIPGQLIIDSVTTDKIQFLGNFCTLEEIQSVENFNPPHYQMFSTSDNCTCIIKLKNKCYY